MQFSDEVQRIEKWCKGKNPGPTKVDIFPTQKCNLDCNFCEFPNVDSSEYEEELSTEELLKIVNEAGKIGAKTFGIIGGEPFVKDGILEIMGKIKEEGMEGSITTNGTLLNEEKVRRIVEMGWDLIRVSIDGIGNTHDHLRGKRGSFSKIIGALKLFKIYGEDFPTVEINTMLNKKNYEEIPEIVELARNYNIEKIILLPLIEFNEQAKKLKVRNTDETQIKRNLKKAERTATKYGIDINTNEVLEKELYSKSNETDELIEDYEIPCFVPWYSISINAKGIATPCSQFEEKFGVNVRNKDLEEIWLSDEFERIREMIANKNLPDTCSKCCVPLLEENKIIRKNIENSEKLASRYR